MYNRHFLKLDDFTPEEIDFLLQLSTELTSCTKLYQCSIDHLPQIRLMFTRNPVSRTSN
jgi:ornithine carbamoyltransferase